MLVLGIHDRHNSSAALLGDGRVVAAVQGATVHGFREARDVFRRSALRHSALGHYLFSKE